MNPFLAVLKAFVYTLMIGIILTFCISIITPIDEGNFTTVLILLLIAITLMNVVIHHFFGKFDVRVVVLCANYIPIPVLMYLKELPYEECITQGAIAIVIIPIWYWLMLHRATK